MTLSMAWIRTRGAHEELVFCSDSRLRFGCAWDSCQKIFPLPRGDCAITFAGDTMWAYPFVHTAINAVSLHRGSSRRQVDIVEVKGVLLNAINGMLSELRDLVRGKDAFSEPNIRLVFGGYSWQRKRFLLWKYYFNPGERRFIFREIGFWRSVGKRRQLVILGDPEASPSARRRAAREGASAPNPHEDVAALASERLLALLRNRGEFQGSGLNMEPFEVLRDIVREEVSPYVGGPPQLVKVYSHMNNQPFGVRWGDGKRARVAVLGRRLPYGERLHVPVLNPDTFEIERSGSTIRQSANDSTLESV